MAENLLKGSTFGFKTWTMKSLLFEQNYFTNLVPSKYKVPILRSKE